MRISEYQRTTVYRPNGLADAHAFKQFKQETGNAPFEKSPWTWVSLALIVLAYPGQALLGLTEDPAELLKNLPYWILMVTLVVTILFQWFIFAFNYVAVSYEGTGLAGIGLGRMEKMHWMQGAAFFLVANLLLSGLAWLMAQVGFPVSGDVLYLVPEDPAGKAVWVLVSMTAGFCEEVAFRGYLMSRLRILLRTNSWVIPTIVSATLFGLCHAYQGWTNVFILGVYGVLFSLLYIKTKSLWPCVIAHFLNNMIHGFWPQ